MPVTGQNPGRQTEGRGILGASALHGSPSSRSSNSELAKWKEWVSNSPVVWWMWPQASSSSAALKAADVSFNAGTELRLTPSPGPGRETGFVGCREEEQKDTCSRPLASWNLTASPVCWSPLAPPSPDPLGCFDGAPWWPGFLSGCGQRVAPAADWSRQS